MAVMRHIDDLQVLDRDAVVTNDETMHNLFEKVGPPISDMVVLALQGSHGFAPVGAALLTARHPTLQHAELGLLSAIPFRVFDMLAIRRGKQARDANVDADFLPGWL